MTKENSVESAKYERKKIFYLVLPFFTFFYRSGFFTIGSGIFNNPDLKITSMQTLAKTI